MDCPTWDGVILAVAAVAAAAIAAWTANHRMERQLDAESQRLDQQLDAESERLDRQLGAESERINRQLEHDRDAQDRMDLRRMLDEGAVLIGKAWAQLRVLGRQVGKSSDALIDSEPDFDLDSSLPAASDSAPILQEFAAYWQRLLLRFPSNHPIVERWDRTMKAFSKGARLVNGRAREISDESRKGFEKQSEEFNGAHVEFLIFCRSQSGVRADDATN